MAKVRELWVRVSLLVSLLAPLWFLVAALGVKFGLLDGRVGFDVMTYRMGAPIVFGAFAIALVGLALAVIAPPRGDRRIALLAALIAAVTLGFGVVVARAAAKAVRVHDVSTDLADPPSFSPAVAAARAKALAGRSAGPARLADGGARTLITDTAAFDAFQVALDTAQAQKDWTIDRNDSATGTIEAHATLFWYGFVDDIAIRVRPLPDGSGTTIDMRSASRVSLADTGANLRRVRAYMAALNANLGAAATGG